MISGDQGGTLSRASGSEAPRLSSSDRRCAMSRSRILHAMSGALRDLLWDGLRHGGPDLLPSRESIVFDSPAQAMGNAEARLSLWLCHVSPDSVSSVPRVRDDDPRRAAQLSL